jgi:hypothetical protein
VQIVCVCVCVASVEGRGTKVERKVLVGQEMIDFTISIACARAKTALDDVDLLLLLMSIHIQPLNHRCEFCKTAGNIAPSKRLAACTAPTLMNSPYCTAISSAAKAPYHAFLYCQRYNTPRLVISPISFFGCPPCV